MYHNTRKGGSYHGNLNGAMGRGGNEKIPQTFGVGDGPMYSFWGGVMK